MRYSEVLLDVAEDKGNVITVFASFVKITKQACQPGKRAGISFSQIEYNNLLFAFKFDRKRSILDTKGPKLRGKRSYLLF